MVKDIKVAHLRFRIKELKEKIVVLKEKLKNEKQYNAYLAGRLKWKNW